MPKKASKKSQNKKAKAKKTKKAKKSPSIIRAIHAAGLLTLVIASLPWVAVLLGGVMCPTPGNCYATITFAEEIYNLLFALLVILVPMASAIMGYVGICAARTEKKNIALSVLIFMAGLALFITNLVTIFL